MKRIGLFTLSILFCGVIGTYGLTYTYKNNVQTGKPDLVTTSVTTSEVVGFAGYTSLHIGVANGLYRTANNTINLQAATNSVPGALTAADHTTFTSKISAIADASDYATGTWTVTPNSFTIVGSPTYTGTYTKIGRRVFCTIQISGTGTIASAAGTSYFSGLSSVFTPARREAVMVTNYGTDVGIGLGDLSTSGNVATPTWSAANNIVISFSFDI